MKSEKNEWQVVGSGLKCIKVPGGHLYKNIGEEGMVLVPDVDLQRYQAHLRDAYKQGYENGHADAKKGIRENV